MKKESRKSSILKEVVFYIVLIATAIIAFFLPWIRGAYIEQKEKIEKSQSTIGNIDFSIEDETQIVYNEVKEKYLSGDWNGEEILYKGHTIKLDIKDDRSGYILIDGEAYDRENLDLPKNMDFSNVNTQNYQYIPGEGTYIIENCKLVKYLRGNKIDLEGSELIPEKLKNKKNYDEFFFIQVPRLVYDYVTNRLFLLYDKY